MTKTLLLITGKSGSGKSTLANFLAALIPARDVESVSADEFMTDPQGDYDFRPERLGICHTRCRHTVRVAMMQEKLLVIVHNTNTRAEHVDQYKRLADEYDYRFIDTVVLKHHDNDDVHGVPSDTKERQGMELLTRIGDLL